MRKFSVGVAVALMCCLLAPSIAQAHVLKTDGDVGAVLHILPDDAPVTQTPTTYELSFRDNSGTFSLKNCKCQVAFLLDGNTVMTQTLAATNDYYVDDMTSFTKPGVYTFRVTGSPLTGNAFTPFTLDYPIRVGNGQAEMQPIPTLLWVGIGMGAALILLYANTQEYMRRRKS